MHIGVLTHNYPRFSGDFSGTFVEALCQEFANQKQQVTVWAPYDPAYQPEFAPLATPTGEHTPHLRLYRYIWPERLHHLGYMRSMQADLALRREGYLLGPNMVAAGLVKVLREVRRLRPDVLHAHWLLPNGFIGAVVSRLTGIPLIISVPGSDAQIANANPLFRYCARYAMRQASLMTANSADLRDAVAALDPTVLGKFELIVYGTDPNALKPDSSGVAMLRNKLDLASRDCSHGSDESGCRPPFVVLCVGRMVYKKGFDTFLRALAEPSLRDHNVIGVMVGEGDQKEEWQQLAAQLGVAEQLRWVGNIPKTEIGVYYNACDVLINPAVRRPVDGLNVCVLDAMSCGKPVVGSTVAGNPLAIRDGETGFLVPEGDPAALAAALARLAADPALVQALGVAARRRIEAELGWPPLARNYIEHFAAIAAQA